MNWGVGEGWIGDAGGRWGALGEGGAGRGGLELVRLCGNYGMRPGWGLERSLL